MWRDLIYESPDTYPETSEQNLLLFYCRENNVISLGTFNGTSFKSRSNNVSGSTYHSHLSAEYPVRKICCYINLKDVPMSEYKSIDSIDLDKFDLSVEANDGIYVCSHRIGNSNGFITLDTKTDIICNEYDLETLTVFKIPQLPEYARISERVKGKYKWVLVDVRDGRYTFNFFRKRLWWWFHMNARVIESYSLKDSFEKAESVLSGFVN